MEKITDHLTPLQLQASADISSEELIAQLRHEVELLSAKLTWYEEQFRLAQAKRFGSSSDSPPPEQLSFINEAEVMARPGEGEPEPTLEQISYARKKKRGTNKASFEELPVERIVYDIPVEERICPVCEEPLHEMSEEIRRELKIIPAQAIVVEHVRKIYACRACQKDKEHTPVVTAFMPAPVISGSFASPSLLAYLMHQKYAAALPLYRQEKLFDEFGIELSRQNMANWIIKAAELWLTPLFERMHDYLLRETFLHADESTLRVLDKEGKPTSSKAYMWLYVTGQFGRQMALYEYQPSRTGKHAQAFLKGFEGYLQSDDYSGYNAVENITRVGCFAHARRYFTDALKALPKGVEIPITGTYAREALDYFKQLFKQEADWKDLTPQERYQNRLEKSQPILEAFLEWLKTAKEKVLPKSGLGKAIAYSLSNWELLTNYLKDGQCELSNNRAERAIKPFVIGRKNFLFCKSAKGARASAMIYSLVESAKMNGLSSFHYLKYLFEQLPNTKLTSPEALDHLLPWSENVKQHCNLKN